MVLICGTASSRYNYFYMALFGSSKKNLPILVIDIGGGCVGAAIASTEAKPIIRFITRSSMSSRPGLAGDEMVNHTLKALEHVLHEIDRVRLRDRIHMGSFDNIFCIVGSPWYFCKTSTIHVENEKAIPYKKFLEEDLLVEEEKIYEKAIKEDAALTQFKDHLEFADRAIINTRLDGYETESPELHSARSFDIGFYMSLLSRDIKEKFSGIIEKYYHKTPRYYSLPLVAFSVLRDIDPRESDYLFVDVSAEVTDITIIKEGSIFGTVSFPLGRNSLIKKISETLNVPENVALSFAKLYDEGKIEPSLVLKMGKVIETVEFDWRSDLHSALMQFSKEIFIPRKTYLSAEKEFASFFEAFARHERIGQVDPADETLEVIALTNEKFAAHVSFYGEQFADPLLAMESIFVTKMSG